MILIVYHKHRLGDQLYFILKAMIHNGLKCRLHHIPLRFTDTTDSLCQLLYLTETKHKSTASQLHVLLQHITKHPPVQRDP